MISIGDDFILVNATASASEKGLRITNHIVIEYDLSECSISDFNSGDLDKLYHQASLEIGRQLHSDIEELGNDS